MFDACLLCGVGCVHVQPVSLDCLPTRPTSSELTVDPASVEDCSFLGLVFTKFEVLLGSEYVKSKMWPYWHSYSAHKDKKETATSKFVNSFNANSYLAADISNYLLRRKSRDYIFSKVRESSSFFVASVDAENPRQFFEDFVDELEKINQRDMLRLPARFFWLANKIRTSSLRREAKDKVAYMLLICLLDTCYSNNYGVLVAARPTAEKLKQFFGVSVEAKHISRIFSAGASIGLWRYEVDGIARLNVDYIQTDEDLEPASSLATMNWLGSLRINFLRSDEFIFRVSKSSIWEPFIDEALLSELVHEYATKSSVIYGERTLQRLEERTQWEESKKIEEEVVVEKIRNLPKLEFVSPFTKEYENVS